MTHHAIPIGAAILAVAIIVLILLPPKYDPAIIWKERNERRQRPFNQADADVEAFNRGECPACGAKESLYEGPSGGMSQNVACISCLQEFNVGFGMGDGAWLVQRSGKLGAGRAKSAFGFTDADLEGKLES